MAATEPSIIDKFRIVKFVKAVDVQLTEYGKALGELSKKYGDKTQINGNDSYKIRPADFEAFGVAKKSLDQDVCELVVNPLPATAYEQVSLTALDLSLLGPFVVEPTDV